MKKCPNCEEELDKEMINAGICDHCGEPLEEDDDELEDDEEPGDEESEGSEDSDEDDLDEDDEEDDDEDDDGEDDDGKRSKSGPPRKPISRPKGRR